MKTHCECCGAAIRKITRNCEYCGVILFEDVDEYEEVETKVVIKDVKPKVVTEYLKPKKITIKECDFIKNFGIKCFSSDIADHLLIEKKIYDYFELDRNLYNFEWLYDPLRSSYTFYFIPIEEND